MVERMADPAKEEGEWVARIDLVEDGPRLRLAEMPQLGKCGAECKTVQRGAAELLQAHEPRQGTCSRCALLPVPLS